MPEVRFCLEVGWGLVYDLGPLQLETLEIWGGRQPCSVHLTRKELHTGEVSGRTQTGRVPRGEGGQAAPWMQGWFSSSRPRPKDFSNLR